MLGLNKLYTSHYLALLHAHRVLHYMFYDLYGKHMVNIHGTFSDWQAVVTNVNEFLEERDVDDANFPTSKKFQTSSEDGLVVYVVRVKLEGEFACSVYFKINNVYACFHNVMHTQCHV